MFFYIYKGNIMNTLSTIEDYNDASERVADECDFASTLALAETARHVSAMQFKIQNIKLDDEFDGMHCVECGEKIAKERIKLLKFTMIHDPKIKTISHPTDRHFKKDGANMIEKHGTDKCITCQSEMTHIQGIRNRQYAF